ncbi:hypothetical protein CI105_02605 [Candidatus Izimaplasma bacterium ZiA1]|uniref:DEAD/DEAH box helicase n=1 Tax=Candidatus Izimoplasma sp. ZiA1 TaxID=2024899 RepID=UPI000BAA3888|nr:hypothetical protein CI105_02605 [Candidatus Izimaplasma bacterium ZiA1]
MLHENNEINQALLEMGFESFTEIQEKTMPVIRKGIDVIGHSQTGTGKTAAFALPILESVDVNNESIQAVILCPTRELAVQVKDEIKRMAKYVKGLKVVAVYGGEPISKQIQQLKKKPQIIVGTPGRTIDHMNRRLIKLSNVKTLVLDEADEMLKMGFKEEIEAVLEGANPDRQTIMFSATMPKHILNITSKYMTNPEHIRVVPNDETNQDITQYYYTVKEENKIEAVSRLLTIYQSKLTLIFCNTKRKVDAVTKELIERGYNVDKIHGDLPQTTRLDVLKKFHTGVLDILVATDVAARGLDIKNVQTVINYEVPEKAEFYVHRIGRTGRIGRKGYSFTLVHRNDVKRLDAVVRYTKATIKKRNIPTIDKIEKLKSVQGIEEINDIIHNNEIAKFNELAEKLLEINEPINIIAALLSKIERNTLDDKNVADINLDLQSRGSRGSDGGSRNSRGSRDSRGSKRGSGNVARYHINLGTGVGMDPKKLADFVSSKTKLRNREISDITVRHAFSFFSTDKKHEKAVLQIFKTVKYNGKKASIQMAKDKG